MKDRRSFLKGSVAATAVLTLASAEQALAGYPLTDSKPVADSGLAGVVYSKYSQGKWQGKAGSHAPRITVKGNIVTVETRHVMSAKHLIIRQTLVGGDGTVLGSKNFQAGDKAISVYELPSGYKGPLIATSFCNLHDLWITEVIV